MNTQNLSLIQGHVSRHLNERGKEPCGYGGGALGVEETARAKTLQHSAQGFTTSR